LLNRGVMRMAVTLDIPMECNIVGIGGAAQKPTQHKARYTDQVLQPGISPKNLSTTTFRLALTRKHMHSGQIYQGVLLKVRWASHTIQEGKTKTHIKPTFMLSGDGNNDKYSL